jgi:adenosine kinase
MVETSQDKALLVFAIGNPLLDIAKEFPNDEFMDKYGLKHASACLASEEQLPLYDELWKLEGIETIPGGSALNTIRATAYLLNHLQHPNSTAYVGCIGSDATGQTLEKEVAQAGVEGHFYKDETTPTGTCAVIIRDNDRSLCANLAACVKYPLNHITENRSVLERAKILYTTSFFITSNFEALLYVAKYAAENNKPLGYNLSAGFLIQFNTE